MSLEKLAIHGGEKAIKTEFKKYNSIGDEELNAATDVIKSGSLSKFVGCWEPDFYGGSKVQEFERMCEKIFNVNYAVTVNSWTSGLVTAVGAIGIEPGDEIIVTPWTMCATATAILHWNAIPVFADIEPDTFNIDPESVKKNITQYTRAIMAVDIFGHSCDIDALMKIADEYNLTVIGDTAQAPGTFNNSRVTGSIAHVGGYSLNRHKHIQTGEGGICVTNDKNIAENMQLIRNHAEAVVGDKGHENLINMIGHNFRMGEIEAAIGIEQLKKMDQFVLSRQETARKITDQLKNISGLKLPIVKSGCTHSYYMYPMTLDKNIIKVSREKIQNALEAEGMQGLDPGYINVHLLPMYQNKMAYGSSGFPWNSEICKREVTYKKGICPVAEELHESTYLGFNNCDFDITDDQIDSIGLAYRKVFSQLESL